MLPLQRLEALIARHAELEAALSQGAGGNNFVKLSREHAELSPVIEDVKALKQAQDDLAGTEQLLTGNDAEMARLAADEKRELQAKIEELEKSFASRSFRKTKRIRTTRFSKCARAPAATRHRCSRAICFVCTNAMPYHKAGRSKCCRRARARSADTKKSSRPSGARARSHG